MTSSKPIQYTQTEILRKATYNALLLIKLYNIKRNIGALLNLTDRIIHEHTCEHTYYTIDQTKEILALAESKIRDYLDH